jgi:hypothetical protein
MEIIIDNLMNYGVLGLWTIVNVITITNYRKTEQEQQKKLEQVIENNTVAVTRVYEVINKCHK